MTPTTSPSCVLGIDYAIAANHAMCWNLPGGSVHHASVEPTPLAITDFLETLCQSIPADCRILVGIEGGALPVLDLLAKHPRCTVLAINPRAAKSFLTSLRVAGTKNDNVDADGLRRFVAHHGDTLQPHFPVDAASAELGMLAKDRRLLVAQRTRCGNTLVAAIRYNCPGLVAAFGGSCPALAKLIKTWPTLCELKARRASTLENFLRKVCRLRSKARIKAIIKALRAAPAEAAHPAKEILAHAQASFYLNLCEAVARYDKRIETRRKDHPLHRFAEALPGMGDCLGPRVIGFLGTDRAKFPRVEDMLCASGIAPVTLQSGKRKGTPMARWACNKFDRQTFHEFARCSVSYCEWAAAYFEAQRKAGKPIQAVYRALAFKWIRIIHACWLKGEIYDESKVRSKYKPQKEAA